MRQAVLARMPAINISSKKLMIIVPIKIQGQVRRARAILLGSLIPRQLEGSGSYFQGHSTFSRHSN
jgi:hypothetical protein